MYKFVILCLFVSLSIAAIFKNNSSTFHDQKRIIGGGFITAKTDIPYQAAIKIYHNEPHHYGLCGGSLITTKFVLTAAHCLYQSSKVLVGLGVPSFCKIKKSRYLMTSTKILPHKNYINKKYDYFDIGLIELPMPVKVDSYIDTINLPSKANAHENYVGYKAIVSGWGLNEHFKKSDSLKYLNTVIVATAHCTFHINESNVICAFGVNNGRTCKGDSGGALVIRNSDNTLTQIGLVSYGKRHCAKNTANVYTRVARYLDWIEQHSNYKFA